MMRRTFAVLAVGLALSAGCSAATGTSAGATSTSNLLTQREISTGTFTTAYEAVERLRPSMLRARSTSSGSGVQPVVFVDGLRRGSPEVLRTIQANQILEIRYLSVQDATTRYGRDVPAGVLDVKLLNR